jgi:hypothetical protein
MNDTTKSNMGLEIGLWAAQLLLAAAYALFGSMKMFQPLDELAKMMTWVPTLPHWFVRTLGTVEVLGAVGLILPSITSIMPKLTVVAALCILVHQLLAVSLHVSRGEFNVLGLNALLIALAAFIFWGRSKKAIILPR